MNGELNDCFQMLLLEDDPAVDSFFKLFIRLCTIQYPLTHIENTLTCQDSMRCHFHGSEPLPCEFSCVFPFNFFLFEKFTFAASHCFSAPRISSSTLEIHDPNLRSHTIHSFVGSLSNKILSQTLLSLCLSLSLSLFLFLSLSVSLSLSLSCFWFVTVPSDQMWVVPMVFVLKNCQREMGKYEGQRSENQ